MTQKEEELFSCKLHRKFRKAVELYGLIEDNDKILIGLSGGKDSLGLVEFLGEKQKIFHPRFSLEVGLTITKQANQQREPQINVKDLQKIMPYVYKVLK